jgi:hypothetical protein
MFSSKKEPTRDILYYSRARAHHTDDSTMAATSDFNQVSTARSPEWAPAGVFHIVMKETGFCNKNINTKKA